MGRAMDEYDAKQGKHKPQEPQTEFTTDRMLTGTLMYEDGHWFTEDILGNKFRVNAPPGSTITVTSEGTIVSYPKVKPGVSVAKVTLGCGGSDRRTLENYGMSGHPKDVDMACEETIELELYLADECHGGVGPHYQFDEPGDWFVQIDTLHGEKIVRCPKHRWMVL